MKILVAEDSNVGRAYIKRTLILSNLLEENIICVENGQLALDVIAKENIELLFLDINMPVLDGIKVVESLAQNNLLVKINVVITSSLIDSSRKDYLESKGVHYFLKKPFSPEALNSVFQSLRVEK